MTQKISPHKVSKMMALYFDGYSQTDIANKLKIDQSTVSLYVSKFKSISEHQGIKAAGEEFGIMDQVQALHSLAAELKKAKLTVEEAAVGLKMMQSLSKLGISQDEYKGVIQACTKMKSEGFLNSAAKLNKLEHDTGMTYEKIVAKAASTHQELKQTQQDLLAVAGKLKTTKEELANIEKQKKLASQELETHMKNVGVDMKRLELVENLALALKKAGEDDKQLEDYIQRQHLLNEAGITLGIFAEILEKAKSLTAKDGGKELLAMLDQYGSLAETINGLENKVQSLTKEANGLEDKAIYIRKPRELNIKFYEGLNEAISLLRFGLDSVVFFQVFIVPLLDEKAREEIPKVFIEYPMPMRDIITNLGLPLNYTPALDFSLNNELLPDPVKVLDLKEPERAPADKQIILRYHGENPLLRSQLDYPKKIREFILSKFCPG